jgi:predicted ester cyclase
MSPTADTIEGRENVEACTQAVVNAIFDFQITVHEMLVGENLVTTESTLSGTHNGEFDEIPLTHETFEVRDVRTS